MSNIDTDTSQLHWFKSNRSGSNGNCVEITTDRLASHGVVLLRDSKNPDVAPFAFTRAEWTAFLGGVQDGDFNV